MSFAADCAKQNGYPENQIKIRNTHFLCTNLLTSKWLGDKMENALLWQTILKNTAYLL